MPLADTSPEYWPRTWQAALRSGRTLIYPTFLPPKRVLSIVRDINGWWWWWWWFCCCWSWNWYIVNIVYLQKNLTLVDLIQILKSYNISSAEENAPGVHVFTPYSSWGKKVMMMMMMMTMINLTHCVLYIYSTIKPGISRFTASIRKVCTVRWLNNLTSLFCLFCFPG